MKTKRLFLACLLMTGLLKADNNVAKGTTLGFKHCIKPGAPIDMSYEAPKVAVGELSDVRVKLVTTQQSGELEVTVTLDEGLESDIETDGVVTKFTLLPGENEHLMNFRVLAKKDGLFYIRLLTKIESDDGPRMRAFAVPVYVGNYKKTKAKPVIMKALGGENISISQAIETIEIINEREK